MCVNMLWIGLKKSVGSLCGRRRRLHCFLSILLVLSMAGLLVYMQNLDLSKFFTPNDTDPVFGDIARQSREAEEDLTSLVTPVKLPLEQETSTPVSQEQDAGSHQVSNRQRKLLITSPPIRKTNLSSSSTTSTESGTVVPEHSAELIKNLSYRRKLMKEKCAMYKSNISGPITNRHVGQIFVVDKYKLIYCEVPKAGCSNWKRILMVLAGHANNTESINHDTVHYANRLKKLNQYNQNDMIERLKTYTKILFVREPMERVVSAYRDKFENPNQYYHGLFGKPIIAKYRPNATQDALKTGDGVTFNEFIHYLLDVHRPVGMDIHWNLVNQLCHPCLVDYDFIGRFENMGEESNHLLRLIGAPEQLKLPTFKDRNPKDKRTSLDLTESYFSQVSLEQRQKVYDFYFMDYQMFNYTKPFKDIH